jgi:hypothetical protein
MKARAASRINENTNEAVLGQASPEPLPALTPRERLQRNIQRLRSLERRLSDDSRNQADLLTSIELIGFKVRHLARQMQETEQPESAAASISGNIPFYPAPPVC